MTNDKENLSSDIILYTAESGDVKVEVLFSDETFWLNQKKLAELFQVDRSVITKHLKNIFAEKELDENSVNAKIAHTAAHLIAERADSSKQQTNMALKENWR
ncbi:MAG: hypothetical protein KKD86_14640 [Bacteroidetes bacterium]|nr:hypothetical protein [Bacteroidota bacterium]MBU1680061.1 hypothetical protein [Bacteroidota bacterium]